VHEQKLNKTRETKEIDKRKSVGAPPASPLLILHPSLVVHLDKKERNKDIEPQQIIPTQTRPAC
jgi:hypothetical protein